MEAIHYLLISTACLSISYLAYLVIARKEKNFKQLRFFLLSSIVISLLIPLSNLHINFPKQLNLPVVANQELISNSVENSTTNLIEKIAATTSITSNSYPSDINSQETSKSINWIKILKLTYLLMASFLIFRIVFQISKLIYYSLGAEKNSTKGATFIYSNKINHPSSFFRWIFLPTNSSYENKEIKEIIAHEKIHVSQYHSFDILLIELLSAVMWFNPLVWMMRNSIQLVHEYLADEGVLKAGIDKNWYQTVLLNQVAEGRLVGLSSSFNKSLIKKRMIMMTKNKIYKHSKSKILILIPLTAMLIAGIACVKGQDESLNKSATQASQLDVLYAGIDNRLNLDLSPYEDSEIRLNSTNGSIKTIDGDFYARPEKLGNNFVEIFSDGESKEFKEFIVKQLPDSLKEWSVMQEKEKIVTAVAPVKMNVLYLGVDNPMAIASSGYSASELTVSIDNGRIVGKNGSYIINPGSTGTATVSVSYNGKVIQESVFRVKMVPDPVAKVNNQKGGPINKRLLLAQVGVAAEMENFDFDLQFKITGFTVSSIINGRIQEATSNSTFFTDEQHDLIEQVEANEKIYIEKINCVSPDGVERELNPIIFRLSE